MTWAPDYVTSTELKDYLRISDAVDDTFVALWITAASRNVDDYCQRQFGQVAAPEARTYRTGQWDRHISAYVLEVDDFYTTTGLVVTDPSGNAVAAANYELRPANALLKGKPYERILVQSGGKFTVTGPWGWSAVPSTVKVGLFLQGARLAARRDSPFGISGSPDQGGEIRLLAQLDPDFRTSLKPLRRDWWAA